jgi:hypothetical protein
MGNFSGAGSLPVVWRQAGDPRMAVWDSAKQNAESRYSHPWLAEAIFALDVRLRRHYAVLEYSADPACIFRLEIARSRRALTLHDGTALRTGARIARLHFWNEHIPPVPSRGATIRWARQMQKAIATSLRELSRFLSSRPDMSDISVICGDVPSATRAQWRQVEYIMGYYGFETVMEPKRLPIGERIHRLGENFLISLTVLAQNARALRFDTLRRARVPIYLSRRVLERKFSCVNAAV